MGVLVGLRGTGGSWWGLGGRGGLGGGLRRAKAEMAGMRS